MWNLERLPDELARQRLAASLLLIGPRQVEHAQRVMAIGRITGILTEKATMRASWYVTETAVEYTNYGSPIPAYRLAG